MNILILELNWIALYELNNNLTCFDSFRVENIPKEIKIFIGKKTKANIFLLDLLSLCLKVKT